MTVTVTVVVTVTVTVTVVVTVRVPRSSIRCMIERMQGKDIPGRTSQSPARLRLRYIVALSGLATLAAVAHFLRDSAVSAERSRAELVNSAGAQRWKSERIRHSLHLLCEENDPWHRRDAREEVVGLAREMEDTMARLCRDPMPERARAVLDGPPWRLRESLDRFLVEARALAALPDEELRDAEPRAILLGLSGPEGDLLGGLDELVRAYQEEGEDAVDRLRWLDRALLGAILAGLVLTGFLIFRPMVRRIGAEMAALAESNQNLEERVSERTRELAAAKEALQAELSGTRRSHEELKLLLDAAPDALLVVGADGRIAIANEEAGRIFGYPLERLAGQSVDVLVPPAKREAHKAHRAEYARAPYRRTMGAGLNIWAARADGTLFPVDVSLSPIETPAGPMVVAIVRDVSWRRRAEAFRNGQAKILELVAVGCPLGEVFRALGRFVEDAIAPARCSILAFEEGEAVRLAAAPSVPDLEGTLLDGVSHKTAIACARGVEESEAGKSAGCPSCPLRPEVLGAGDLCLTKSTLVLSRAGEPLGAICCEIGRLADYEDERVAAIRASSRLAAIAIEREREAAKLRHRDEELRQAQKMDALGRLAGGIAHDFNNILTAITGYAEEIASAISPGDPRREDARQILDAAGRAGALTKQLLAFGRKQILAPRVLDLNAHILETCRMLARLLGERIELVADLDPASPCIRADPSQLDQLLLNLAVNARDAMPEGGKLTIETRLVPFPPDASRDPSLARSGPSVLLAVTDTGVGMDAATRERIFEPFFSTKAEGKGTGLGLATVHGIVKQSGGEIRVSSEPGKGARFEIYFPCAEGAPEPKSRPWTDRIERPAAGETILIAEDEEPVRRLLVRAISARGYRVLAAATAREAIEIAAGPDPIDLLLTDVVLPDIAGPELARRLREMRPGLRVLLATGYAGDWLRDVGAASPWPVLSKPFSLQELARKIREVLEAS
ncbi:MAG: PAS domain S-box protein [Planctomycetes bacterium]|nr:PAS domain S-box protein [Planctomycetota bacterium]